MCSWLPFIPHFWPILDTSANGWLCRHAHEQTDASGSTFYCCILDFLFVTKIKKTLSNLICTGEPAEGCHWRERRWAGRAQVAVSSDGDQEDTGVHGGWGADAVEYVPCHGGGWKHVQGKGGLSVKVSFDFVHGKWRQNKFTFIFIDKVGEIISH